MIKTASAFLLGTCALALATPSTAVAQVHRPLVGSPNEPQIAFNIRAGTLKGALDEWMKQSGRQLIYAADDISGVSTKGVKRRATPLGALMMLLGRSGLTARLDASGAIALTKAKRDVGDVALTPDILVRGKKDWSLNQGIERTQNDSQPFIVLTQADIKRSGAADLETFLRDNLTVNTSASTGRQAGKDGASAYASIGLDAQTRGLSNINLRGLGAEETLILVDGRRQPGVNLGDGTFGQAQITGIPLASIERIEVLASSASSIYGSGASGGVINIVLKQNYSGGTITATYGNTGDFKAGSGRIDLSYAKTLEDGRTNISFSGSWNKAQPLRFGDRVSIRNQYAADTLALTGNNPLIVGVSPVRGETPNYVNASGGNLTLKPAYGGTRLSSSYGTIPYGYQGLLTDGIGPLLAGVGKLNTVPAPDGYSDGRYAPLTYGNQLFSGMLSVRRKMSDWLTLYVQGMGNHNKTLSAATRDPTAGKVSRFSASNPFTTDVYVALPVAAQSAYTVKNTFSQWQVLGGALVKLPKEWQANIESSYSRSHVTIPSYQSQAEFFDYIPGYLTGALNPLQDVVAHPLQYQYGPFPLIQSTPQDSSILTTTLNLAGPLPLKLPGGNVGMTINLQRAASQLGAVTFGVASPLDTALVSYQPSGRYTLYSSYGEIAFPIVGPSNKVPFVNLFDIRVSARG